MEKKKKIFDAKHHYLLKRHFGADETPLLLGYFGPYSLSSKQDRKKLRRIAKRILKELEDTKIRTAPGE